MYGQAHRGTSGSARLLLCIVMDRVDYVSGQPTREYFGLTAAMSKRRRAWASLRLEQSGHLPACPVRVCSLPPSTGSTATIQAAWSRSWEVPTFVLSRLLRAQRAHGARRRVPDYTR